MDDSTKTLKISNFSLELPFNSGDRLLDILNANNISISQSCGGHGSCTTCRVFILKGLEDCSPRTDLEQEHASERDFKDNERLCCQTFINGNCKIFIEDGE